MLASLRRATSPEAPPTAPAVVHTPLFHDLASGLGATTRPVVLDLGAASTAMLALLGRARSRVEIADLAHFGDIDCLNATEPGPELSEAVEEMLPNLPPDDGFSLVFCWDLPNYLTLDALSTLMNAIARRARPGAIAHVLIHYAKRDMPERPARLVPTADGDALLDHGAAQTLVAAPRYSPEDLAKSMGGFAFDRARLLGNGMQEFLFKL